MMKDQEKSKSVETFSPQEFETFLGAVRPDWLAWLAIGVDPSLGVSDWVFGQLKPQKVDQMRVPCCVSRVV